MEHRKHVRRAKRENHHVCVPQPPRSRRLVSGPFKSTTGLSHVMDDDQSVP